MDYRTFADLSRTLLGQIHRLPRDIDLIVAVPRSGMIPASIIALALNLPLTDVEGLLSGRLIAEGRTRRFRRSPVTAHECKHALVIDDSVRSGGTMEEVRNRLLAADLNLKTTFAAVYATKESQLMVDLHFDICPFPRIFEWNFLHHAVLRNACVDIDGVLCVDPTPAENDDGPRYARFLAEAQPLHLPTVRIHRLVTSRLEKYRSQTEAWLKAHGIEYDHLSMLDLPDAATRRRLKAHAPFKTKVYQTDAKAILFIESEPWQAKAIAHDSGKPALCVGDLRLYKPEALSKASLGLEMTRARRHVVWVVKNRIKGIFRSLGAHA